MSGDDASNRSDVGFKRPPVHTRFAPGRSGNPAGRPKRRPSFRDVLAEELNVPVRDSHGSTTKLHALVKTLVEAAIGGNGRAQTLIVGFLGRLGEADDQVEQPLTTDDHEILEAYRAGELEPGVAEPESPPPRSEVT